MAANTLLQKVLSLAGEFVAGQKGVWGHDAWEALVGKVAALGIEMDDEAKRNLGNILESCRHFHALCPACAPAKKAPAKAKAKAK